MMLRIFISIFLILASTERRALYAQERPETVKAAYLYNFAKFTTWPTEAFKTTSEFHICAIGDEEVGNELLSVQGRQVGERKIRVRSGKDPSEFNNTNCQIIYLSAKASTKEQDLFLEQRHILFVSDGDSASTINFYQENEYLRFSVSLKKLAKTGLECSSQLLKIARISDE